MLKEAEKDPAHRSALAIVDERSDLIYFTREDGCSQFHNEMAIKKAYTSAMLRATTHDIRMKAFKQEGLDLTKFNLGTNYTSVAGGVPILKPGEETKEVGQYRECIGAIGTSIAPELEDERMALVGVKAIQDILWPAK